MKMDEKSKVNDYNKWYLIVWWFSYLSWHQKCIYTWFESNYELIAIISFEKKDSIDKDD